jgi:alkylation response protein AidB-like acyl-CoA dehydrogenase
MNYQPRPDDIRFLLFDVLDAPAVLAALPPFAEVDADLMLQVLDEAAKFAGEVVAPLTRGGDEIGCRHALVDGTGKVTMPPGFRDAYQAFWQAGWPALACAPEDGGQGLPALLDSVLYEWLNAANHGWSMAPGIQHGAYACVRHHGSDELKGRYLGKMASGEWLATMCLTEPHAGSDLGMARTKGVPQADGSYAVSGTKIFISSGEHDLTDNIVHLVLGRLPDAPAGPKGLSLFLTPKWLPDGTRNSLNCDRIEEKMGLHGSATCVMRFDGATGWLIGEAGRGLNAMFVMMNAARLQVGLQGVGLLDAAWQKADAYARERRQMRAPGGTGPAPHLIGEHPAVRRILDTQRAWIDGGRLLGYLTALELDIARHHPDAARRTQASSWCSLITPVLKAAMTDQAFHGASECLQVFGGHGYVREWGIEQIVRDSRVSMIYEGTNEIQAIDLLVRKVLVDGGTGLADLLLALRHSHGGLDAAQPEHAATLRRFAELRYLTTTLVAAARADVELPYWVAGDYLRAVTLALLSWAWCRIDAVAAEAPDSARWSAPALAFRHWVLPEFEMRLSMIRQRMQAAGSAHGAMLPVAAS